MFEDIYQSMILKLYLFTRFMLFRFLKIITNGLHFPFLANLHPPRLGLLLFKESLENPTDGGLEKEEQGSTSGANEKKNERRSGAERSGGAVTWFLHS